MPRAHLRYVLTGEIVLRIDKLITYISDPLDNEDPEPHNKSYSAGETEMLEQELVRKNKKGKHNTQKTKHHQHTKHTEIISRIHTNPVTPCKNYHTSS